MAKLIGRPIARPLVLAHNKTLLRQLYHGVPGILS